MTNSSLCSGRVAVKKPWGKFEQYTHNVPCTTKIITVKPGGKLSCQYHHNRDELWVVLDPDAQVEIGDEVLYPEPEEEVFYLEARSTVSPVTATGRRGSLRSPSASSMRTTSCASKTSMVANNLETKLAVRPTTNAEKNLERSAVASTKKR